MMEGFNPCLFVGKPDGKNTLYLGLYVDDFVYFSPSSECEAIFEQNLRSLTSVDFMGTVSHFLGIKFQWKRYDDGHLDTHLSQPAFAEQLIQSAGLSTDSSVSKPTPFCPGCPIDTIPNIPLPQQEQDLLTTKMRSLVGSLLWLSQGTRNDLSTITSLLAQYQANPSPGHLQAAKYAICYLKGTKNLGITFSSRPNEHLESFLHFPVSPKTTTPFTDANWGPQDQSKPKQGKTPPELDLFKARSMSGFLILFNGPIQWASKRQKITARSSAEAEIYATDECVKELLRLRIIWMDLIVLHIYMPKQKPITVFNDNMACVYWSKATTTKGLRHITIRENAIREAMQQNIVNVKHIAGNVNLANIFTKEIKYFTFLSYS